jgi:hypothetical protein
MKHFSFWQKWLFIVSLGITAFGLFMALFNHTALFDLFNQQIDPVFWESSLPQGVASFQGWLYGVWGSTVAGWGIFLAFIAHYPFKQRQKWAWNCLAVGLGVWFVLDTWISWRFGVTFNVFFNFVVVIAAGLPLVFTRKEFHE